MTTESDRLRFENIVVKTAALGRDDFGIGTYKEKSLHYILKSFFESDTDYHEVAYRGYVADVKRDDFITEIQTSTLRGMKGKLDAFLPDCDVRIVFPISTERRIVWIDPKTGDATRSSRPAAGDTVYDLLSELVYIVEYLAVTGLTVTAVFLKTDDYRLLDGYGKYKKMRATKLDRVPTELIEVRDFVFPRDLASFVPETLPEEFGRLDFGRAAHLGGRALWGALKVLEETGVLIRAGKDGNRIIYRRAK